MLSCCVLHEMNRQNLVKNGLLDKLDAVFDKNKIQGKIWSDPDVVLGLFLGNFLDIFRSTRNFNKSNIFVIYSCKSMASSCPG